MIRSASIAHDPHGDRTEVRTGLLRRGLAAMLVVAVVGCGPKPATGNDAAASARPTPGASPTSIASPRPMPSASATDYLGRWIGVEGMVLDVAAGSAPDRYRLTMQYDLDHRQTVEARREGAVLVFDRDGVRKTLRPTDGVATGLKYLAAKKDCLTVASGEGYCRD